MQAAKEASACPTGRFESWIVWKFFAGRGTDPLGDGRDLPQEPPFGDARAQFGHFRRGFSHVRVVSGRQEPDLVNR